LIKQPKQNLYAESNQENEKSSSISWKVYRRYFGVRIRWFFIVLLIIALIGSHSLFILCDWWLARWYVMEILA